MSRSTKAPGKSLLVPVVSPFLVVPERSPQKDRDHHFLVQLSRAPSSQLGGMRGTPNRLESKMTNGPQQTSFPYHFRPSHPEEGVSWS